MFEKKYFEERNQALEPKHEAEVRQWIKYFSLQKTDKVFIHGCGYGQRLHWFNELGITANGMDVSEYAKENAYGKAKGKITNKIPASTHMKGYYDLLISIDVLEHIQQQELISVIIKLANLSNKAVYGITYMDNKNYPKDKTHINPKRKEQWRKFLLEFYDRVYDAPTNWIENNMYLIAYRFEK